MADRIFALQAHRSLVNLTQSRHHIVRKAVAPLRTPHRVAPRQIVSVTAAKTQGPTSLQNAKWTASPEQEQALEQLRAAMAATPYVQRLDDDKLRWFLLDRKLDVTEARDKLVKMMTWRDSLGADSIQTTDIAKEAATGKAYIHHHLDIMNRPVLVVRASKHLIGAAPLIDSQRLCVHLLDRGMQKLPEGQETMLGIFDLRGFGSKNADLKFVRFMVDAFFIYYPKRVSQILFVDAPWVFGPMYEVVKPWLKKYAALVRFVSVDELRREYFTAETLPEDFSSGGFPKTR